jgi:hypothetical protein
MPESGGPEQKILVKAEAGRRRPAATPQPDVAWVWIGWLGLVLALAGLTDLVLLWVPTRIGSPEWEFATVVSTASAMPLVSIGLAALLASGASTGKRWLLWSVGSVVAVGAVVLVLLLVLFLTNVPMALKATSGEAQVGILKATVKTVMLAGLFGSAYAVGAVWSFRLALGKARSG